MPGSLWAVLVLEILVQFNDQREVHHLSVNGLGAPMSSDPMTMTIDPCPVLRVEYCMCESQQRKASVKPWRAGRSESPDVTMSYRIGN